jgi:hypothetical protein
VNPSHQYRAKSERALTQALAAPTEHERSVLINEAVFWNEKAVDAERRALAG